MAPTPRGLSSLASLVSKRLASSPLSESTAASQPQPSLIPRTTSFIATISRSIRRQINANDPSIIPTQYGSMNSGPEPGTVAGIVLGSVAGFLLILWLIYSCLSFGQWGGSDYTESVVVRARRKSHHGSQRSRRISETVEVRRAPTRSPVRIVREPEPIHRVIVEESRETRREVSRGGSDEVVVIEDHSPPRRSKSKRHSEQRDPGGYRTVDPHAYGGVVGGRRSSGRR